MRTLVSLLGAATAVRSLSMPSSTAGRRTILVTGSTDGIGKFTAGKLAAAGRDDRPRPQRGARQDTVEQLRRRAPAGATIEGYVADLSDMAQVRALARSGRAPGARRARQQRGHLRRRLHGHAQGPSDS